MFIAVCNQPRESRCLIRWLEESMPDVTFHTVELDEDVEDPLDAVLDRLPADAEGPVMVLGLERSNPSNAETRPVLYALNLGRAEWVEQLPQPVVFWLPEYLLGLMGREAPDFLDWRSDTVHFPTQGEEELAPLFAESWNPLMEGGHLSAVQRRRRISELRSRIAALPGSPDSTHVEAYSEWLEELGSHLAFLGEMQEAQECYEEALSLARQHGLLALAANCLAGLLNVASDLGEVEKRQDLEEELKTLVSRLQTSHDSADQAVAQILSLSRPRAASLAEDLSDVELERAIQNFMLAQDESLTLAEREGWARKSIESFKTLGDQKALALALAILGQIKFVQGDLGSAKQFLEEALQIAQLLGARPVSSQVIYWLAGIAWAEGRPSLARDRLSEAHKHFLDMGMQPWARTVEENLRELDETDVAK